MCHHTPVKVEAAAAPPPSDKQKKEGTDCREVGSEPHEVYRVPQDRDAASGFILSLDGLPVKTH